MSTMQAAIAAHRFGLGEKDLAVVGDDGAGWLVRQIGPGDQPDGAGLMSSREALKLFPAFVKQQKERARDPSSATDGVEADFRKHYRQSVLAELDARWSLAASTPRPFAERLALFWANHFTVSAAKPRVAGLVGPFEREAIRPNIAGRFGTLLRAAVIHPAMLVYLDNAQSIGPDSPAGRRRERGLNENLAREILELHTLGVEGGYGQQDVIEFAKVLTGWTVRPDGNGEAEFIERMHQPGSKTILGRRFGEAGAQELEAVLDMLATHPSTARHISTKLARHFVSDDPAPALVDRLAQSFTRSGGDLSRTYRSLLDAPEAWAPGFPKLKRPEELAVSTLRVLGVRGKVVEQVGRAVREMGQPVGAAPSPAGWGDRAEEWLGPDAMWKRIEWADQVAARAPQSDTRALAQAAFGPSLSAGTLQQIERAESSRQALALFLASPEFQRR
ncbi:DUF1800 family protein [Niveibacterium umoris]|uniref:Uncharacterized protein (DUF1800 family) n=1 Tax=Niveibacterium umoris TaxID=1193620 RepID=A0A840BF85_9RHOO|nr:DUF1800 domain-containing protein [Niveibacterium umoris]MBB4012191.1 uncharacterized protein (DUF1800 family) [Niveibacterium umoris]